MLFLEAQGACLKAFCGGEAQMAGLKCHAGCRPVPCQSGASQGGRPSHTALALEKRAEGTITKGYPLAWLTSCTRPNSARSPPHHPSAAPPSACPCPTKDIWIGFTSELRTSSGSAAHCCSLCSPCPSSQAPPFPWA